MAGEAKKQIDKAVLWGGNGSPFSMSYGKMMMWFFILSDALTFGGFLVALGFKRYQYDGEWPIGEEVFQAFPGLEGHYPLMYVALMTFILIVSSVTMVLAVEAGHRNDKKGVIKWMISTVVFGFIFVGSQAWEWGHFIHGSEFGKVVLSDGSYGKVTSHGHGDHAEITGIKVFQGAHVGESLIATYTTGQIIPQVEAKKIYLDIKENDPHRIYKGASMKDNEYGPQAYANYFFFITGFHGFHVLTGVLINLIILINVMRGVYDKRGHFEMVEKVGLYWHFVDLVWVFVFTFFYLI